MSEAVPSPVPIPPDQTAEKPIDSASPRRGHNYLRWLTIGAIGGAITAASGFLGLVYELKPDFRPDPGVELSGSLNVLRWEARVQHDDYLSRTHFTDPNAKYMHGIWGDVFYVEVAAHGLKRDEGTLRWYVYSARTNRRVQQGVDNVGISRARYGTTSDRFIVPIWYQPPVEKGPYRLRFEFYARGVLLALADSPKFAACEERGCGAATG